jgi:hypothetical protein
MIPREFYLNRDIGLRVKFDGISKKDKSER